jgi:hypothetical protein
VISLSEIKTRISLGPKEVLERLILALSSGIWGVILDRDLVEVKGIEEFFTETGLWGVISIDNFKNYIVVRINERGLRNKCLYERCSKEPQETLESCLGRCILNSIDEIKSKLIELSKSLR